MNPPNEKKMYLYGGGGHASVVAEVLASNGIELLGIFDDDTTKELTCHSGIRVQGDSFPELDHPVILTIGDNRIRAEIASLLETDFGTAVHVSATISPSATIGQGTVVLHGALIQANTSIGQHAIINTGASIDHDNLIGDFAHISPQAALSGHVEVGEGTHIGTGACVIPCVKIGKWCSIGAGSVVINDIPDYCTAVGNPAKVIKQNIPITCQENNSDFDLVLIGSGLAATSTLESLIENLHHRPPSNPLRIAIIEKADDFFGGVAYGQRAGTKSLTITSLNEFLPEPDRQRFKQWLSRNKSWALKRFHAGAGPLTTNWLMQNTQAIEDNQWENLYLPRYLFGLFLTHKITEQIKFAEQKKLIEFIPIQGTVTNLKHFQDGFRITVAEANHAERRIRCRKAVLSIGSPPKRKLFGAKVYDSRLGGCLLDDVYEHDFTVSREKIKKHLNRNLTDTWNFLVVGSNASAIELLYNLWDQEEIRDRLDRVFVLSPSAELPACNEHCPTGNSFAAVNLDSLLAGQSCSAQNIYLAAKADIERARAKRLAFGQFFDPISQRVNELATNLSESEKQYFVDQWGVEIGKLQRRAGREYSDAIKQIQSAGKLEMIRGRFERIACHGATGCTFDYADANGQRQRFPVEIQVAVNCAGFERVSSESSSKLIRGLIRNRLCRPTPSGFGILVDERLAASEGLYVIGPLLAGNIVGENLIWHAEHCGRIIQFSKRLAAELAESLPTRQPTN
jgi:sugar O-acyltransferase (sialic acid O-acetyltransferase NeuD family)